jgi:membrane peptidoglycan carboxypeptidase
MKWNHSETAGWRQYQQKLQRKTRRRQLRKRLPLLLAFCGTALALVLLLFFAGARLYAYWRTRPPAALPAQITPQTSAPTISQQDLALLLNGAAGDLNHLSDQYTANLNGTAYTVHTFLDTNLQKYILRLIGRARTLQSAVIVLNPHDGRVLAMASRNSLDDTANLCLKADYPAASLFKIVSAAAALEAAGYYPDKPVSFKGGKHTLYKYQLKTPSGKYISHTRFRNAFASSNNAVFGKLGIFDLGRSVLSDYAAKFLFNRRIAYDLPVAVSKIEIPANDFGLAEIASGFNKKTRISPLHAVLLATVPVNRGDMPAPRLVNTIQDKTGGVLYHSDRRTLASPVNNKTATALKALMNDAARYGTARKFYRRLRRKKKFVQFSLGAKTGTINDSRDNFKYDWITAYALPPGGKDAICIGVLGVHGKILGIRSTEIARAVINYYFTHKKS